VGTPDERWGETVTAVVQLRPGAELTVEELSEFGRTGLAGYKLPRRLVLVDEVQRGANGKPDYAWAKATAVESVAVPA
jgi:fatty-acyl-CoA synthase